MKHTLESRRLARSTLVDVIPSAVGNIFKFLQGPSPTNDGERNALLRATKYTIRRLTTKSVSKLPILKAQLEKMVRLCPNTAMDIRDIFLLILMFMGFMRESEAVGLQAANVWTEVMENGQEVLFVVIKKSKMDQFGESATIVLGGSPGNILCPVMWYKAHMAHRIPESPHLFHKVDRQQGGPLKAATPNHTIKKWLRSIGVDPKRYGSHSLRRGGATAAARAKIRTHVLKRHGRWESDAVYLYVVDDMTERLSVSAAMLGC
jgi:integrase